MYDRDKGFVKKSYYSVKNAQKEWRKLTMESGGYFLIAVIVLLVIGVISGNAKRKKDGGEEKKEVNQ